MIVVDTSVLIMALGRRPGVAMSTAAIVLRRLIEADTPLAVPGIVCQELLAGARTEQHFERLRGVLEGFPILVADQRTHERAARIAALCRWSGVAASAVDCLIAAQTVTLDGMLYSLDKDFERMAPHCGLVLFDAG
ncbi:hypothetical protein DCC79_11440 [bacterium]|nr:PIN domain-containing protein [Chloroflexi bacterium CFX6]RIL09312.1 MAG: hypothetical protein DCC79_11440 [bacterium]